MLFNSVFARTDIMPKNFLVKRCGKEGEIVHSESIDKDFDDQDLNCVSTDCLSPSADRCHIQQRSEEGEL